MPPPTMSRPPENSGNSNASLESMTRGSVGNPGRRMDSEPAAMMHWSKRMRSEPLLPITSTTCGLTKRAEPCMTSTLRCFARVRRPPVSLLTTDCFHERSAGRSIAGAPKTMPCSLISSTSSMTFAACSKALEGMQPTFKHTPPRLGQRSTSVTCMPRSAARKAAV